MSVDRAADLLNAVRFQPLRFGKPFDLDTAFACAHYAALTYHSLSAFDYGDVENVLLVPSAQFELRLRSEAATRVEWEESWRREVARLERRLEGGTLFEVISTSDLLIVIMETPAALVIAIRGTTTFHDIVAHDLSFVPHTINSFLAWNHYHAGFHAAAREAARAIRLTLSAKPQYAGLPIMFTGHSLGGAAAAILHANPAWLELRGRTIGGYVFGTPGYATVRRYARTRRPFHVRFEHAIDYVPDSSPYWLGYSEIPGSMSISAANLGPWPHYCLHGTSSGRLRVFNGFGTLCPGHDIEHYLCALECLHGCSLHGDLRLQP